MRSLAVVVAALLVASSLFAACGGEDSPSPRRPVSKTPYLSLEEVRKVLEDRANATTVRTGLPVVERIEPTPLASARMRTSGGDEFDVLIFASPTSLRVAWPSVKATTGVPGDRFATRAANVLATFPRGSPTGAFAQVLEELERLSDACQLNAPVTPRQRLCFGGRAPAGQGADVEEPAPPGTTVMVGGLGYTVRVTRQLNPRISPDRALVGGRRPGRNMTWLGAFLRVCNRGAVARTPTTDLVLADASGRQVEPTELPASNKFEYEPRPLPAGRCIPPEGSAAARIADGALVLFEVPIEMLEERPLSLRITGPSGITKAVQVDL